jgi:hypothetical protein
MEEIVTNPAPTQEQPQPQQVIDLSDKNQALLVLVNAAKLAQSKGVFSLEEAELVSMAIKSFMVPQPEGPQSIS